MSDLMQQLPQLTQDKLVEAVAEALGDAYDCIRAWRARGIGSMGPDDFLRVADDSDRVAAIVNAALDALRPELDQLEYVRQVLARTGFAGPITPAGCPLEDLVMAGFRQGPTPTTAPIVQYQVRGIATVESGWKPGPWVNITEEMLPIFQNQISWQTRGLVEP